MNKITFKAAFGSVTMASELDAETSSGAESAENSREENKRPIHKCVVFKRRDSPLE